MDEVGQKLRAARIAKGYTLDDLQKITKIQKRYLIAIEEGNFDALPGNFYVRAFIKQYADSVGLDGSKLLQQYEDALPSLTPQEKVHQENQQPISREQKNTSHSWWVHNRRYMPQIIIIALVVIVIGGIWIIAAKRNHTEQAAIPQTSSVKISSSSASKSTSSVSHSLSSSSSSQSPQLDVKQTSVNGGMQTFTITNAPQNNNQITLSALPNASSWTSVSVGGRVVYQGVITATAPQTINIPNGVKQVIVKSGNAPKTTVKINNKDVNINNGVSTTVRTLTFDYK